MSFRFENSGPAEKADLELGDLTVVSGLNKTGKTSIVYALYGFLNGFDGQVWWDMSEELREKESSRPEVGTAWECSGNGISR